MRNIIYTVQYAETFDTIGKDFGINPSVIKKYNGAETLRQGQRIIIPIVDTSCITHIVKPAETLLTIADMYNVSIEHIKQNNHIDTIFVGQHLSI